MYSKFNKVELQIIAFINLSLTMICANDKRCTGLNKTVILNEIKSLNLLKYESVYRPENFIQIISEIKKNHKQDMKQYKLNDYINSFIAYVKNPSDQTWIKVLNMYNEFKGKYEGLEEKVIKVNEKSVKVLVLYLKSVVEEISGRKDSIALSFKEYKKLIEKNKSSAEKYVSKYNELMRLFINRLRYIFKTSGETTLTLSKLNKGLESANFPKMFSQDSEDISFDAALNIYAKNGTRLSGRLDPYKVEITINPQYDYKNDTNYVLTFQAFGAEGKQFMYSIDYKRKMNKMKYEKVWKVIEDIETYRKKWLKFIDSDDFKSKTCAVACEVVFQTTMRIGTPGNKSKGEDTFGLLTLEKRHISLSGDSKIEFDFLGKGGGSMTYSLEDKRISKYFHNILKNKNSKDSVFKISGEDLNKFINGELHMNITVHKFRTLKATQYVYKHLIEKFPFKKPAETSQKEKLAYLQKILLEVGEMLKHHSGDKVTTSTALKNYIDPSVIKKYYELCKMELPKQVQQLLESDYSNPDPDAFPEIPKTYPGTIKYPSWAYYKTKYFD